MSGAKILRDREHLVLSVGVQVKASELFHILVPLSDSCTNKGKDLVKADNDI